MIIFAVVYSTFIDDQKLFVDKKEANKCKRWTRRKLKLPKEDKMLRVVELTVHEKFKKELYEEEVKA